MHRSGGWMRSFTKRSALARSVGAVAIAGLFVASCDVHRISKPGELSTISISPNPQTITVNGKQQMTAVGLDDDGAVVTFTPTWTIVGGGGAISTDGMFTPGGVPNTFTNTI